MRVLKILVFASVFFAATVFADPRGIYLGVGVGQSFIKADVKDIQNNDLKLDDNDFAYKFIAGVRMTDIFAIEGGYKYLGNVKNKVDEYSFESKISGYDLCAVGNLYLGIIDVFGKAGVLWWDQENHLNDTKSTDSNNNFMWGFGATVRLNTLGIRAEWERFELPDYDRLSLLSVGLIFHM